MRTMVSSLGVCPEKGKSKEVEISRLPLEDQPGSSTDSRQRMRESLLSGALGSLRQWSWWASRNLPASKLSLFLVINPGFAFGALLLLPAPFLI